MDKTVELFREASLRFGVIIPPLIIFGRWTKCQTTTGQKDGGYYFELREGGGAAGNLFNPHSDLGALIWEVLPND